MHRHANSRDLRIFALLQGAFWGVVCYVAVLRGLPPAVAIGIVAAAAIALIAGIVRPASVRRYHDLWMLLVFPIGWVVSHVLMAIVYFAVVTPVGWRRRKTAGDPLQREDLPQAMSYWQERTGEAAPESYFRQF